MRLVLRLLSLLLGLALTIVGALLVVEVAWAWLRPTSGPLLVPWPTWRSRLDELTWASPVVRWVAIAAILAGLLLLLLGVAARSRQVPLRSPSSDVSVTAYPRLIAKSVRDRVRTLEGVRDASVTATARQIRVQATSRSADEVGLRQRLVDAVHSTIADLSLARSPKVIVTTDSSRGRS
ncbi:MAG TPA: DUF6286 domain-containing protein [Pseudonocardiaceae bacterium]